MDQGLIPRRYAKALYEVGEERKDNARLYDIMQTLADTFSSQPKLAATIANPFVSDQDKRQLLTSAVNGISSAAADKTYEDFIGLLLQNKRADMAYAIARAFVDLYRSKNSIYRVNIVSAAPMSDKSRKRIEDIISSHIGKGTMEYYYSVDPSLIGGFTVTVNSERLDASVANELKQLKLKLVN